MQNDNKSKEKKLRILVQAYWAYGASPIYYRSIKVKTYRFERTFNKQQTLQYVYRNADKFLISIITIIIITVITNCNLFFFSF